MKKYLTGFIVGIVLTGIVFIPILKLQQKAKYEFGNNHGEINGLLLSAKKLEEEFGVLDIEENHKRLYSVKTTDVVSVEVNGVKTVRVIP